MKNICIQGLGFVGVAMAAAVADSINENGSPLYHVTGVELDNESGREKVASINVGNFPFDCEDLFLKRAFRDAIRRGNLRATTDVCSYTAADIVIVDVNLDVVIKENGVKTVSWDAFKGAIKTLGEYVNQDTLVIIETTIPPGTCERVVLPILRAGFNARGLFGERVLLAHSYERVMPGKNYLSSIKNYWRVYAGCDGESANQCESFLRTIINTKDYPLTRLSSPCASETAKVMENSYRAANIAFIQEWSSFSQHAGIDIFEVIDAIKMRPTHCNMMYPGFGVGGYCLTKDPLFAGIAGRELFGYEMAFPFCEMAVETNNAMPLASVALLERLTGGLSKKHVLLLGISYRQDVGDTRYSPSEIFAREIISKGATMEFHDPYVPYWKEMDRYVAQSLPESRGFDAVVFGVAHNAYKEIAMEEWLMGSSACILDTNNVLTADQRERLKSLPNAFAGVGRG